MLPGTYTVAVQFTGFTRFVQENVLLQSRSDVTVDAVLKPGDVREAVTVTDQASTVQFNTSKLETTVDSSLVSNLPQMSRNPLLLARLDPAVVQGDTQREQGLTDDPAAQHMADLVEHLAYALALLLRH